MMGLWEWGEGLLHLAHELHVCLMASCISSLVRVNRNR